MTTDGNQQSVAVHPKAKYRIRSVLTKVLKIFHFKDAYRKHYQKKEILGFF